MKSYAIILLKPDALERNLCGNIIDRLEGAGLTIERIKTVKATLALLEDHYKNHIGKEYFPGLINAMCNKKLFAVSVSSEGRPAFAIGREVVSDVRYYLNLNAAGPMNLIHCSDSDEEAARELAIWFLKS